MIMLVYINDIGIKLFKRIVNKILQIKIVYINQFHPIPILHYLVEPLIIMITNIMIYIKMQRDAF